MRLAKRSFAWRKATYVQRKRQVLFHIAAKQDLSTDSESICYLTIRGGSLKNIAKNIIPNVPINKKVYTKASIIFSFSVPLFIDASFTTNLANLAPFFALRFAKLTTKLRFVVSFETGASRR